MDTAAIQHRLTADERQTLEEQGFVPTEGALSSDRSGCSPT